MMANMGQHSASDTHAAAARPLRRAHFAAWSVFISMAGTSMIFQTYHAYTRGHMPGWGAFLYGVVPLALSIGLLEVASVWQSRTAKGFAWAATAGSMFLSAFATGAVTASAAPPHAELLFGAVCDLAALLSVRFILDGPTAAQAVAAVAKREAELIAAADAERAAREQESVNHAQAVSLLRADLGKAAAELADTERRAAEAEEKAETFARKLAANSGPKGRRNAGARNGPNSGRTAVPKDVDARAEALRILAENPGISGRELGEKCGRGERWGQLRKQELTGHVAGGETTGE